MHCMTERQRRQYVKLGPHGGKYNQVTTNTRVIPQIMLIKTVLVSIDLTRHVLAIGLHYVWHTLAN